MIYKIKQKNENVMRRWSSICLFMMTVSIFMFVYYLYKGDPIFDSERYVDIYNKIFSFSIAFIIITPVLFISKYLSKYYEGWGGKMKTFITLYTLNFLFNPYRSEYVIFFNKQFIAVFLLITSTVYSILYICFYVYKERRQGIIKNNL